MATSSSQNSSSGIKDKTLTGIGNLIKLLPTGTSFIFLYLSPVLTNNGHCNQANKISSSVLVVLCGCSCVFSTFTDSYTSNGKSHYGIATLTGLWPSTPGVDLSNYKLRFGDLVHASFSLVVFTVFALMDGNMVNCFYPSLKSTGGKILLMGLPPVIGAVSGSLFVMFPNTRHWVGYPHSTTTTTTTSTPQESSADHQEYGNEKKTIQGSQV